MDILGDAPDDVIMKVLEAILFTPLLFCEFNICNNIHGVGELILLTKACSTVVINN